jgi:hypothetical protein
VQAALRIGAVVNAVSRVLAAEAAAASHEVTPVLA